MTNKTYLCCPSCTGTPMKLARTELHQCQHCGYIAPTECFESPRKNAEYRLRFPSAIFGESAEDAEKYLRKSIELDTQEATQALEKAISQAK